MQSTFKVTEKKKKKTSFCEPTVLMGGGGGSVSSYAFLNKVRIYAAQLIAYPWS